MIFSGYDGTVSIVFNSSVVSTASGVLRTHAQHIKHLVKVIPAADHRLCTYLGQHVGMVGIAMRAAGEADDAYASRNGSLNAVHRILDDEGLGRIGTVGVCGV